MSRDERKAMNHEVKKFFELLKMIDYPNVTFNDVDNPREVANYWNFFTRHEYSTFYSDLHCEDTIIYYNDRLKDNIGRTVIGREPICLNCGDYHNTEGNLLCESCNDTVYCSCCDRYISGRNTTVVDAETICNTCFNEYYSFCDSCQEYHHNDDMTQTKYDGYICQSCLDDNYCYCQSCDEYVAIGNDNLIQTEDGNIYCSDCFEYL
jgi:hypothetical protein